MLSKENNPYIINTLLMKSIVYPSPPPPPPSLSIDNHPYMDCHPPLLQENLDAPPFMIFQKFQPPKKQEQGRSGESNNVILNKILVATFVEVAEKPFKASKFTFKSPKLIAWKLL